MGRAFASGKRPHGQPFSNNIMLIGGWAVISGVSAEDGSVSLWGRKPASCIGPTIRFGAPGHAAPYPEGNGESIGVSGVVADNSGVR